MFVNTFALYYVKFLNLSEDEIEEYNFSNLNDEQYLRCNKKINSINFETNIENDIINDELIARFNELKSGDSDSSKDIFLIIKIRKKMMIVLSVMIN